MGSKVSMPVPKMTRASTQCSAALALAKAATPPSVVPIVPDQVALTVLSPVMFDWRVVWQAPPAPVVQLELVKPPGPLRPKLMVCPVGAAVKPEPVSNCSVAVIG